MSDQAFVTLATTDAYAFGAMVLGRSLRRVGTSRQLAIMVGPGLSLEIRYVFMGSVLGINKHANFIGCTSSWRLDFGFEYVLQ